MQEIIVKKAAQTDPRFGKSPEKRTVEELIKLGVVAIDKPPGPTSHQVSDYVQKILGLKKAGHGGSLDPQVVGVLPVALENATRLAQVLLKGGKEYVGILHLHDDVSKDKLLSAVESFVGKIRQMPPVRSAVKRQWRHRSIYSFDILEIDGKDVLFKVYCEAGTYIRKLCHDLGTALKVGAHMLELRRIKASTFTEKECVTLQDLKDAFFLWEAEQNETFIRHCIKPAERMVEHLPKVWLFDSAIESVCHGRDVAIPGISKLTKIEPDQLVAVMSLKNEIVALGVAQMSDQTILKKDRGIAVKTNKVFMDVGTYID